MTTTPVGFGGTELLCGGLVMRARIASQEDRSSICVSKYTFFQTINRTMSLELACQNP